MDKIKYQTSLSALDRDFESLCRRCGECCGAGDDPCASLRKDDDGLYYCDDYTDRFGARKTLTGRSFNCVPIREHVAKGTLRPNCGYRYRRKG